MNRVKRTVAAWYAYLSRHNIMLLSVLVILLMVFGATSMVLVGEKKFDSWGAALWYSLVTMTTVGYGDLYPESTGGRVIGAIMMIVGVGVLGMFSGTFATMLVERNRREDDGLSEITVRDHFVVCGWNSRALSVVEELLEGLPTGTHLVIVAELDRKPIDDEHVFFVKGDATDERVLRRANVTQANSALILSGGAEGSAADAKAVLTTLTIETINPDVYTCVELQDPSNAQHCKRANANEILVSGHLNAKLIANSFLHHGASEVFSELISGDSGCNFIKIPTPDSVAGMKFPDALKALHEKDQTILIGVESDGKRLVNPKDHVLRKEDQIFVVS